MGACRENANIFWYLFNKYPSGKWAGWELFSKRIWKNPHLWHDSFGSYWYRWVACKINGHKDVKDVSESYEPNEYYCFNCQKYL